MRFFVCVALSLLTVSASACLMSTARSVRTTADATAFVREGLEISELRAWVGVDPTVVSVYNTGSLVPAGYILQYKLADGTLSVTERRGPDGVARAGLVKVTPR